MAPKHFIREWRKFRGMTMEQVASQIGTGHAVLSRVERGDQRYNQELLEKLADILRTTPADLIMRDPSGSNDVASLIARLTPGARSMALVILDAFARAPETPAEGAARAEADLLGCMMYDHWAAKRMARSSLSCEMFEDQLLGGVYELICDHADLPDFVAADLITVDGWLQASTDVELKAMYAEAGGMRYLADLTVDCPPVDNIGILAGEVAAADVRRSITAQIREKLRDQ